MRKKNLLLFLMLCIGFSAMSQVTTNVKVLQNFAHEHRVKENTEQVEAIAMANKKGWPIHYVGKNGTVFALQRIDFLGNPIYYNTFNNTIAAATTRANQLWPGGSSGLNLSGSSDSVKGKLGIWDGGLILKNHVELVGRIFQKDSSGLTLDDHATHTTGTLIASGVNPIAKGMAYGLKQLIAYYGLKNDGSTIATEAPNLILSNHSYGITGGWLYDGTNWWWNGDSIISKSESFYCGYYNSDAQSYDQIAYNAPNYLMVFAAGNSNGNNGNGQGPAVGTTYLYNGNASATALRTSVMLNNPTYGSVSMGQCAKNILVVGAVNGIPNGYSTPADVQIASFSSWGPTDDGRIKPDVVGDGVNVTSSSSTSTTAYETMSGTSMAAPNVTGSLLLLQEYYNQKFGKFMRSATLKGLAIQTADEAGTSPGPDYVYGYGLLDVLKASNVITSSLNHKTDSIIEQTLTSGTPYTFNVVASGNGPLKATIVWTDPAATPLTSNILNNTSPRLINDLDLRITSGSSTYYPWILNPAAPAAAATKGDDKINNIEQVIIDSVVPGKSYTITVSNKGTLAGGSQAFSMILSGIGGAAYCNSSSTNTTGSRIDSVAFSNIANKNAAGHSSYSNFTNLTANIQPNQTIPITIQVNSSDNSSANRVVKVYMDFNNNGTFTDAGEFVASNVSNISSISGTGGTFTATITTPNGLTVGNYGIMRIVLQDSVGGTATVGACNNYPNGETQDYRFKVVSPNNDVAVVNIVSPNSGTCSNGSQYLVIAVKNNGSVDQANVPLVATITNGASVTTLTGTYPSLAAGSTINYTFQTAFASTASATYTIKSYTNLSTDQNKSNDTSTLAVTIAAKPSTPTGTAEICGTSTVMLVVSNPNSAANYLWSSATTTNAVIATSTPTSSTSVLTNYYLASGFNGNIGITSKNNFPNGGGYQANGGNYMNYTSTIPLTLTTARLFTGYAGQVTVIAADISNVNTTTGSYSYLPLATSTIDVYATKPTPIAGSQPVNDPTDTGAVFYINLPLPSGSHSIICTTDATATIFRNNNVTGNPYPFNIPNVFSLTGNSAISQTNPTLYQGFYYYLYNMNIQTSDCVSDMGTIVPITAPTPVASANGNVLSSNITTGKLQWNLNGNPIAGATGSTYTNAQTTAGTYNYTVTVTDVFGCSRTSNTVAIVVTAVQNANPVEIGLVVSPNPNNGAFHVGFTTNTKADVSIELINTSGQICLNNGYSNFVGQFSQQFSTNNLASGSYILKVQQNGKVYQKQMMIIK